MRKAMAWVTAVALTAAMAVPMAASAKAGGGATLTPAGDLKWGDVEGFPGVKMAPLRGDPGKSANHIMVKLPAGFSAPLHHHTSDHYVMVVAGTLVLNVDGKDTKLPPGSYFQFTGKKQHLTRCEAGADCTLFIDNRGKWDVVPVADKKAPAKK